VKPGAVALAHLLAAMGCAAGDAPSDTPVVAVSVLPLAYFVERIAGEWVEVEVMIPPGASPATFEPTFRQVEAVSRAVAYVQVGHPNFPFEAAWLDRLIAENPKMPVINASARVDQKVGDPHVWVSPRHAKTIADNIAQALTGLLPERAEAMERNRVSLLAEIDEVDAVIRQAVAEARGRRFLVFHPAWGYLADEYGLEQVAIEVEGKEPNPADLTRIIELVRESSIRVILVQPQFSRAAAELIAGEAGCTVETVDPLAKNWPVNMRRVADVLRGALN